MADTLETVTAEDRAAWEQLEQQAADAAFAAKEGAEMADAARMQAMNAFDDCTATVDAQQGAKVAADMHAKEISKQKFKDTEREKGDRALAQKMANAMR